MRQTQDGEALVAALGREAERLVAARPGGLRRVRVRSGEVAVELEWDPAPAGVPVVDQVPEAAEPAATAAVLAPMVGTFYQGPEPGAAPFVRVGDVVAEGAVVGIVEAMKMMNKVLADQAGTVAAVPVRDGEPVEFGQPLLLLERAGVS
ncbi:biotin/lipoyl-containing protein [Actinokineospora sp. NBRC 105648]|uniref:acetyl-CoA carboxylase biotin carboxyl carrier protein n=1 Tax=Actinokineospora sp. NBRC 105648 TaxID=3032206 RepID=UPI0024A01D92|nr:biotin/lipoyl-containing protein [Actinokineospora sp. NBRC 105648]GLZ42020.1 hypothetical protein Acsp05_56440 [Actinokineospora sp. NBRC 105648]